MDFIVWSSTNLERETLVRHFLQRCRCVNLKIFSHDLELFSSALFGFSKNLMRVYQKNFSWVLSLSPFKTLPEHLFTKRQVLNFGIFKSHHS